MTHVELKRNFKRKDGYTRITMDEKGFGKVKIKHSLCYPAIQEGKYVEYVQNTYEVTKEEANQMFTKFVKQGFSNKVTRTK